MTKYTQLKHHYPSSYTLFHRNIFSKYFFSFKFFSNGKKVRFSLEKAMKAQRGSRGITLLLL
jgi:hypothetical protein